MAPLVAQVSATDPSLWPGDRGVVDDQQNTEDVLIFAVNERMKESRNCRKEMVLSTTRR
jgi:hypothetical protein